MGFRIVENDKTVNPNAAVELGGLPLVWLRFNRWLRRKVSRYIPHLVWPGQEIDVRVTFDGMGLEASDDTLVHEAGERFRALGINFDTGSSLDARDWEWDFSLSGPLHVRFVSSARRPENRKRRERPALTLVS